MDPELKAMIRDTPLFAGLSSREQGEILSAMMPFSLLRGEALFNEGDRPVDGFYLLRKGLLGVWVRSPDGDPVRITELGPGELVGEMGLIDDAARSASVRAVEACKLVRMPRDKFSQMRRSGNPIARKIMRNMCRIMSARVRDRYQDISDLLEPPSSSAMDSVFGNGLLRRLFTRGKK